MATSVLRGIVTESLVAFPEDAHLRVFEFLSANGASESEKVRVQQAWSKVSLAKEAFGRKKGPVDPVLFGEELVKELAAGDKELLRLEEMETSFRTLVADRHGAASHPQITSLSDLNKSSGVLASLQSLSKLGADLAAAMDALSQVEQDREQQEAPVSSSSSSSGSSSSKSSVSSGSVAAEEAILSWRKTCRRAKLVWHGRKPAAASPLYCPLSSTQLACPEVIFGEAVFKAKENKDSVHSVRPTSQAIVGLKITSKQPGIQARVWTSYQCLHEILGKQEERMRLFAVPIAMQRDSSPTSTTPGALVCAFELPGCRPLSPLLSPAFATFLRRYPSVVLTWCAQLGSTARNLQFNCASGRLLHQPTLADCFIKDNGHLLVANSAFEKLDCEDADEDEEERAAGEKSPNDISPFIFSLLATCLSLSRKHSVQLVPTLIDPLSAVGGEDQKEVEEERPEEGNAGIAKEEIVSIMEGCTVDVAFTDHICRGLILQQIGDGCSTTSNQGQSSRLHVAVIGETGVSTITTSSWSDSETSVRIKATGAGLLLLRAVAPAQTMGTASDMNGSQMLHASGGRRAVDVRIVVVPAYPVVSVELQELLGMLEASSPGAQASPSAFMRTKCIISPSQMTRDELTIHHDWNEVVLRTVDMSPPAVNSRR